MSRKVDKSSLLDKMMNILKGYNFGGKK